MHDLDRLERAPGSLLIRRDPAATRHWPVALVRVVVAALVIGGVLLARAWLFPAGAHERPQGLRVSLLDTPRPPPRPPEKPPEPVRADERTEVVTNAPPPPAGAAAVAPDPALGVDADAQGAGDGFGLVAKRGGRDLTTIGVAASGPSGFGDGLRHRAYAGLVLQRLLADLRASPAVVAEQDFVVVAQVWIDARGRVARSELGAGSGHPGIDRALRDTLARSGVLPEPPADLPQPLRFRITVKDFDVGGR